ncbi:MAG: energy transducer TonB [Betaproteobacteria bacterium]|nr:energy transducer TonB [Betaproteobacteria bacterium]
MRKPAFIKTAAALLGVAALSLSLLAAAAERPLKGDPPEYPREAIKAGYSEGLVKVRMTVDPTGEVSRVEVVDANPRRVFDRATVRALSQWRYASAASARVIEMELHYKQ